MDQAPKLVFLLFLNVQLKNTIMNGIVECAFLFSFTITQETLVPYQLLAEIQYLQVQLSDRVYSDENQSELKYKSTVQTLTEQGSLDYPPLFSYVPSEYLGWKQYWECIHGVVLVSNVPLVGIQWKEYFAPKKIT